MPPCLPTCRTGPPGAQPREGGTQQVHTARPPLRHQATLGSRENKDRTAVHLTLGEGPRGSSWATALCTAPVPGLEAALGREDCARASRPALRLVAHLGVGRASGPGSGPRLSSDPHGPPGCAPGHHPIQTPPPDRCLDSRAGETRGARECSTAAPPASRGHQAHAGRGPRQASALSSPHHGMEARPPGLGRGPHRENGAPAAPRVSSEA